MASVGPELSSSGVPHTDRQLLVGLLVAVGIITVVRDLLGWSDRLRLAAQLDADPEAPGRAAEDILREEEDKSGDD